MATSLKLSNPPEDGITSINFHPTDSKLLATSWDTSIRLYNTESDALIRLIRQKAAILDGAFLGGEKCITGGLQKKVFVTNIETDQTSALGTHEKPVKCVNSNKGSGLVYSGSWDKTLKGWDPRSTEAKVMSYNLKGKVFSMDVSERTLVVAGSDLRNYIFDLKEMKEPLEIRESPLRKQSRQVRINPDEKSFAISSIGGRVSIEYLDKSDQSNNYKFKCHRVTNKERKIITAYPINAMAFNPKHCTFATGGCDGIVNIWDGYNKKRVSQLPRCSEGISALAFDCKGVQLAVAMSYTWENGPQKEAGSNSIKVRKMKEKEVKTKIAK